MSKPVVFHLVHLMREKEKSILKEEVQKSGRKPLKNLLDFILHTSASVDPEKEIVFLKTFGKKYTEKQDGILRNEYGLLKKMAEDIMAMTTRKEENEKNPLLQKTDYLKYLARANEFDLFEKEAAKVIEEAENRFDYFALKTIYELYTLQIVPRIKHNEKLIARFEHFSQKHRENVARMLLTDHRESMSIQFLSKRTPTSNMEDQIYDKDVDVINFAEYEDVRTQYAYYKVLANTCWGEKRLVALQQCLYFLNQMTYFPKYAQQKFGILSNLAGCYAEGGDYENANHYLSQIEQIIQEQSETDRAVYYCNYASCLIHAGLYDEALHKLHANDSLFARHHRFTERVMYLKAAIYAFKGMPEMLNETIPQNFSGYSIIAQIDCRFFACISYYMNGDMNTAKREVNNLYKTIYEQNDGGINLYEKSEETSKHFLQFFTARCDFQFTKDKKKLVEKMKKVKALTETLKNTSPVDNNILYYKWLIKEIDKYIQ